MEKPAKLPQGRNLRMSRHVDLTAVVHQKRIGRIVKNARNRCTHVAVFPAQWQKLSRFSKRSSLKVREYLESRADSRDNNFPGLPL